MRPLFLDVVEDWVGQQIDVYNSKSDAGFFFGDQQMRISSKLSVAYHDCFSDFLVFEYRPIFFYYKTGLEYFVEYNPQNLDQETIGECREILDTNVSGIFVVRKISSKGVEIYNKKTGKIFIKKEMEPEEYIFNVGMLFWARVARVNTQWFFVCDFLPQLSLLPKTSKSGILINISSQSIANILFSDREVLSKKQLEHIFSDFLEKINKESSNDLDSENNSDKV